jgi:hypothetical protein
MLICFITTQRLLLDDESSPKKDFCVLDNSKKLTAKSLEFFVNSFISIDSGEVFVDEWPLPKTGFIISLSKTKVSW